MESEESQTGKYHEESIKIVSTNNCTKFTHLTNLCQELRQVIQSEENVSQSFPNSQLFICFMQGLEHLEEFFEKKR